MKKLSNFEKTMLNLSSYIGLIVAVQTFPIMIENFSVFLLGKFLLGMGYFLTPWLNKKYLIAQQRYWKKQDERQLKECR